MTISPAHSGTIVQESGEIWTAETRFQPILPKSDSHLKQASHPPAGYGKGSLVDEYPSDVVTASIPRPFSDTKGNLRRVERKFVLTANDYTH